ncbi:amino acid ABC transporter substrate-binding protein, PAAT family [Pseudomonas chlororaphis]|jgi:polar amino acid transport system substrate-binding protein|uniref:transporter substrate-binding domain-containing protein n=1 Tax=Pseudomonas chlororaphis TaxID=587753 RepID=UPI000864EBF2|nr:transporter substrate-binding domain-containing protein [Pseudomonas chlororaphis]AZD67857.1 ABC transporter amino acid-binding protein [Pseudomonas chlororaphis subsp. aurantiaca]QIT23800.1 transporter substrate-binding domain-containing protein [Pseudomonas chlororaphis subsp. aurantiaca]WDH01901.1 transporter substrate-binding domain-containing protein [Pseudomonas chlororaphis]WDH09251.1 transporter substrate-binding domain-containing protein [Pseudomonas chlororaphis]SDS88657.1 amino a
MLFERSPVKRLLPVMLGALISLAGSAAVQADATLDKIQQRHVLVVGVLLSGGPFGGIDPTTQKPRGLNVDLAQELGRQLGAEVQLVPVLPANRVQFLQQGKVDLLIANMEWTAERGEILGFVPTPFYRVGGTAAVLKGGPIARWEDLKNQPVCTSQGSSYIKPLTELGVQIKAFKSSSESLLALRGNNCVAAVHDATLINPLIADSAEWQGYRALTPELNPAPSVIWTRRGESDTQARLDPIIKELHRSGWLIEAQTRNRITPASPALVELQKQFQANGA